MLAGLIETSLLVLRPEAMNDESDVAPGTALGSVPSMSGAKVGSPGERQRGSSRKSRMHPAASHWCGRGCSPG